jgi:hypothetical protein
MKIDAANSDVLSNIVVRINVNIHADNNGLYEDRQIFIFDMGIGSVSIVDAQI